MYKTNNEYLGEESRISATFGISEQLENEKISPKEYVKRRVEIMGEGNIIQNVIFPYFQMIWTAIKSLFVLKERND